MHLFTGHILILLVLQVHWSESSIQSACAQQPSGKLLCNTFPACQLYRHTSYAQFEFADSTELNAYQLANCHISSLKLTFEFNNVARIHLNAFSNLTVAPGSILTIKFDPSKAKGKQVKNLVINQNAFKNLRLGDQSQLILEVANYQQVIVEDSLVHSVFQRPDSAVHLSFRNLSQIIFNDNYTAIHKENTQYTHNKTYSLAVASTDSVYISSTVFQHLQITPYSSFSIAIRYILQCRFEPNSFEHLQLGDFVHFSLLIESADSVYLGADLFAYLNQATGSQFSFQADQIGMSADTANDYEDYYEAYDSEYSPIDKEAADWFCIPSGLVKNAQLAESAIAVVQLSRFESSISVSGQAFDDIELGDNAKLQVFFNAAKGHIFIDSSAFHFIRINEGIFEVWVKEHRFDQTFDDELRGSRKEESSKQAPLFESSSNNQGEELFQKMLDTLQNSELKLNKLAFDKIFLSARSYFRFGYINSDSTLLLDPRALNGFHTDQMAQNRDKSVDDRTKISLELSNDDMTGLHFIFPSEDEIAAFAGELSNFPKVIEIEAYEPTISIVHLRNDSSSLGGSIVSVGAPLEGSRPSQGPKALIKEFCRFYQLRSLMAPIQYRETGALVNSNGLVYFSESIKQSLKSERTVEAEPLLCTSCLLMYLYRTIHRREDFYYVKDHLPSCFLNLHYKDNLYFSSYKNANKRREAGRQIERDFKKYWSILNCPTVTGLDKIFQYHNNEAIGDAYNGDESYLDLEQISGHCERQSPIADQALDKQIDWHQYAQGLCKQKLDRNVKVALRKALEVSAAAAAKSQNDTRFNWTLFCMIAFVVGSVGAAVGYFKRHGELPGTRHLDAIQTTVKRLKSRSSAKVARFTNADGSLENSTDYNYDELNEYEYDDDFDVVPKTQCTSFQKDPDNFSNESHSKQQRPKKRSGLLSLTGHLFSRDKLKSSLLNVTNTQHAHFKNKSANNKYPYYGYKSTETSAVSDARVGEEKDLTVNYDIHKRQVDSQATNGGVREGYQTDAPGTQLNLETNPLDCLDFEAELNGDSNA